MSDTPLPTADEQVAMKWLAEKMPFLPKSTAAIKAPMLAALLSATRENALRSRSAERREWLSIESAPMDGTKILGWIDDGSLCRTVRWVEASEPAPDDYGHDAGWASAEGATYPAVGEAGAPGSDQPIYWQPLPSPPSKTE